MGLKTKLTRDELTRMLHILAIDPLTIKVKKFSDDKNMDFYTIIDSDILKNYNNCYSTEGNVTLIIMDRKAYLIPKGIIKEYNFITSGLKLEYLDVPLSNCLYKFEDSNIKDRWDFLLGVRDNILATW